MELTVYWCLLFSGRFQENATDKYQIYHRNIPLKYHRFQQMSCPLSVRPAVEPLIGYFVLIPQLDKKSCWSGVVSVVFRLETRRPWNPLIEKLLLLVCPSLKNDYIGLQWFISLYHVYACLSSFWSYSIDNFGGLCPISRDITRNTVIFRVAMLGGSFEEPFSKQMAGGYFGGLNKLGDCIASIIAIPWRKFRTYTILYIYILSIICITCITE
jgi:hypothetical protein